MLRRERRLGAIGWSVKAFSPDAGYAAKGGTIPIPSWKSPVLRPFRRLRRAILSEPYKD
jgi:hypothetical protein